MSHACRRRDDGDGLRVREDRRRRLVREVASQARALLSETAEPPLSRAVLRAMLRVRREHFVPASKVDFAYANAALSIGHGQTISQPLIVAIMTHLLRVGPDDTVLEVGTGSGYQAAVLCEIARHVYTVEVVEALARSARERLSEHGYDNVTVRTGDGGQGWPEHAPYEGVIVTAAAPAIPQPLLQQLRPGGRMLIPLGRPLDVQWLTVIAKQPEGRTDVRRILPVRFVPLTGASGAG